MAFGSKCIYYFLKKDQNGISWEKMPLYDKKDWEACRILVTGSEGQRTIVKALSPEHSIWTLKFTDLLDLDITDQKIFIKK